MYISMSNGYDINNSTNAVFPFTFIFKSDDESRGFFFFYTHMWIDFTASALFKGQKRIANCVERPSKRKREQLNNERIWRSVLNYLNLHLFLFATSRMN